MAVWDREQPWPEFIAKLFVPLYYDRLQHSPDLIHEFYKDISKLGRPEEDGSMSITTTIQAINEKILSLNYGDFTAEIKSMHAQDSFNGGILVLVTGCLTGKDNTVSNFSQAFFLAPQPEGYFVLNDSFRYMDSVTLNTAPASDVVEPTPAQEIHISEESNQSVEETDFEEVYSSSENGDVQAAGEEDPGAEVVE